ncbi:DMT family transporter [Atopomonas sediminilitoris]|uniref:DMT family transporter n=1 Tax=Atopomonas sediminilitoris TaxID=2919919 RepID=UPI001F4E669A|nr:DMT family transporter [Atopomonas sediminilitoris]MCJ8170813.1 DMT family transporter [Atopomonas sediminilitoris]
MQATQRQQRIVPGALLLGLSALLFSLMGVGIRELSTSVNNESVVFFRNLVGVLFFLPLVVWRGWSPLRTNRLRSHLWRAAFGLAAMYCFFYAIAHLPLADAMLFTYSAPVFTPFIAYFWLKEALSKKIAAAAALGFIGVLLVAKPSDALFEPIALVGLAASILAAFAFVSIREMSDSEPAFRIVFYFALFSTLLSAIPLLWAWQPLNSEQVLLLAAVGLLATTSQIIMSKAYSLAPPGIIGPFAYLAIVFSALIAWWQWNELPSVSSCVGALLIFASSLAALWANRPSASKQG